MALAQNFGDDALITLDLGEVVGELKDAMAQMPDHPAAAPEVVYAFQDTLRDAGVELITVATSDLSDSASTLRAIYSDGQDQLRDLGVPDPDVGLYVEAANEAHRSGEPIEDVLDAAKPPPLQMRTDLPERALESPLDMDQADLLTPLPDMDGSVAATQYEVHVMAYPLKTFEGLGLELRDSHAFIVVTEAGRDPANKFEAKIVTRGGPDETGWKTSSSPDSSFPDEQSPDKSLEAGNVYIGDYDQSIRDYDKPGVFNIETYSVAHDLETLQEMIGSHRALINREDIDYELINRNSNTYVGDTVELLTGETPNFTHIRHPDDGSWRRLPAFDNDLMDYSKTEFAEEYGYEPPLLEPDVILEASRVYTPPVTEEDHGDDIF